MILVAILFLLSGADLGFLEGGFYSSRTEVWGSGGAAPGH